ncbi:MAG TPA: hypothetical protein VKB75_16870 [Jatrophihabitans sp.]|nr:hypothetical protein [Jatrophihabitans sp.]
MLEPKHFRATRRGETVETTSTATVSATKAVLRRAAEHASLAPSVHNSQPWTFVLRHGALDIRLDPARRLPLLDPRGRQMMISCGCAVLNARVAIGASGYVPCVERFPDPADPNVVARLTVGAARPYGRDAALDRAVDRRHTNRRTFVDEPVPAGLIAELTSITRNEGATLVPVTSPQDRALVAELMAVARRIESDDPEYLQELWAWTTDDPRRVDGVQAATVPYHGEAAPDLGHSPVRPFDLRSMGWLPAAPQPARNECLMVLCSHTDDPSSWLRVGEALEHVWLELTDRAYWASPIGEPIEVRTTAQLLRDGLRLSEFPHLMMRVGRAPDVPRTRRRPESDVIVQI